MMRLEATINGEAVSWAIEPYEFLTEVLRRNRLTGTVRTWADRRDGGAKYGCGRCGASMVASSSVSRARWPPDNSPATVSACSAPTPKPASRHPTS